MDNVITRSKFVNETISIVLDFSDQLQPGETISTVVITVSLFTGTDSDPSNILFQTPSIVGTLVDQKFCLGIPGSIYEISYLVTGSSGTKCVKTTNLAILPQNGTAIPSFTVIYQTSLRYPIQYAENLQANPSIIQGSLWYNPSYTESIQSIPSIISGQLFGGQVTYSYKGDQLTTSPSILSGELFGGQTTYDIPPEGIETGVAILSGTLAGGEVDYIIPAESITTSPSITGGTLT